MSVTKNEKQEIAGNLFPVFGVTYDLSQPKELEKAIQKAEKEKAQAKEWFEQTRRYLMRCSNLLSQLQTAAYARKEVCHE